MNYFSLRYIIMFIIMLIIIIVYLFLIKKHTKKRICILIIALLIIYQLIMIIPIEEYFIKFNTLEEAFNYSYNGYQIIQVIEKDEYAFVICSKNDGTTKRYTHFIKENEKWKVTSPYVEGTKSKATSKGFLISVNRIKGKNIMFVSIGYFNILYENLDIRDSIGTDFRLEKEFETKEYKYYSRTAIIEDIPEDYYLIIDGEKIEI